MCWKWPGMPTGSSIFWLGGRYKYLGRWRLLSVAGVCGAWSGTCMVGAGHRLPHGLLCSGRRGLEQHLPPQEGWAGTSARGSEGGGSAGCAEAGGGSSGRCSGGRRAPLIPDLPCAFNCPRIRPVSAVRACCELGAQAGPCGRREAGLREASQSSLSIGSALLSPPIRPPQRCRRAPTLASPRPLWLSASRAAARQGSREGSRRAAGSSA